MKKESERLHKQIKDYESNLRNNFQQRQERFINKIKEEKSKQSAFGIPNEKQFHEDYLIKYNLLYKNLKDSFFEMIFLFDKLTKTYQSLVKKNFY